MDLAGNGFKSDVSEIREKFLTQRPSIELRVPARTSESPEIHHELQIDFGPASEVRSESQGFFFPRWR